jgi:hypothetical protein
MHGPLNVKLAIFSIGVTLVISAFHSNFKFSEIKAINHAVNRTASDTG